MRLPEPTCARASHAWSLSIERTVELFGSLLAEADRPLPLWVRKRVGLMSLQSFVATNRDELIKRARAKVGLRSTPQPNANELEHGVPIFLSQLAKVLDDEVAHSQDIDVAMARSASLHGQDLHKFGFTIEQVVHDYGDVCQAVTGLALELNVPFTTAEFQTLNRCLDNAIAGAVTSWNAERERPRGYGPSDSLEHDVGTMLDTAIGAYEALHSGHVGAGGATSVLLGRSLRKMRTRLKEPKKS
jgi:hypothetical protein